MDLGLLEKGQVAVITGLSALCKPDIRQRLLDLGFVRGAEISIQNISPLNDPIAYSIHDTQISLRRADAAHIFITLKGL